MDITNKTNFVERNDTVNAFVNGINKYTVPTPQEEKELFVRYEDAKTEEEKTAIKNEIITRNLRFVYAVAKRYTTGDSLPDLVDIGCVGMEEAFDEYDWRSGNRFTTFAIWYIRRAIYAYLIKENQTVRVKSASRISSKVKKIENDFYLKNGRKPATSEIIDILSSQYGLEVKDDIDIYGIKIDKLESYIGEEEDNTFDKSSAFNEKTSVSNEYESTAERESVRYALESALSTLSDREKMIVCMAYGYGPYEYERKDKEIASELGITSERVRQLRHQALKKMRSAYLAVSER